MSSESLTLQQLKDMKQLAKLMGADSMGTVDGATAGLSVHAATASGATGQLATDLNGKLDATADAVKAVVSGDTLNIHIEGNASHATTAGTATTASGATGQLATDLNGKLDSDAPTVKNLLVGHILPVHITGTVDNNTKDNKMGVLEIRASENISETVFYAGFGYRYGFFGSGNTNWYTYAPNGLYAWQKWGLKVHHGIIGKSILLGADAITHSDARIKMNIEDVPDTLALDQVRQIPCRYYEYKDKADRGAGKTVGFIAQEVKEVLPMAVKTTTEFIPDHMRLAEVSWEEVDGKHMMMVSNLDADVTSGTKVRFMVYTGTPPELNEDGSVKTHASDDYNECKKDAVLRDDGKFEMDKVYDGVLIIGREVDDFLVVNKAKIFALHHSAIQELDKTVEAQKATIAAQQAAIDALMARVAALEGQ